MRPQERIPIICSKIKSEENFNKILTYWFGENCDICTENVTSVVAKNIKEIEKEWLDYPDMRLTQILVSMGIIPNIPGFWYYSEDEETMVESGIMEYRDILFWTSIFNKKKQVLPSPIKRLIKDLDTTHIQAILTDFKDGSQLLREEYLNTFKEELKLRKHA